MYIPLLTKIKNAQAVRATVVRAPYTKMDEAVLKVLAAHSFIAGFEKKGKSPKRFFDIALNPKPVINGISFVSTPGRRIYKKYTEIRPVKQGYGKGIISTPEGIMTDQEAKKKHLGGCMLFHIW